MKNRIIIVVLFFCVISTSVYAQVAMGKWRTYFAYNSVSQIAQSDNKIFAVSEGALFSVDKLDAGMEFYSKLSGLNSTNISRIEYDPTNKQLLIVYTNGNIDILSSGGVSNIPDLYNKQMSASKLVNQIQFYQNKAYLACDFGIVVLNTAKKEVADTYYIGSNASEVKVLTTTVQNDTIYALTSTTLYKASINNPNLVNYAVWKTSTDLPGSGDLQSTASFTGKLFILRGGKLYKQESNNSWTSFRYDLTVSNFNVTNGSMNVFSGSNVYLFDNQFVSKTVSNIGTLTDAEFDTVNNTYWFAANEKGVISYNPTSLELPHEFKPKGPAVNVPAYMTYSGNKLFVVNGLSSSKDFIEGIVMMYENGTWTNIYGQTISNDSTKRDVFNFMNTAVDPTDNKHFFITSWGTGLYEFRNNAFYKWHNHTNSTIRGHIGVPGDPWHYTRLDGAIYDASGNLFLANSAVDAKIKVLLKNGVWTELKYSKISNDVLGKILINNQNPNQKWVTTLINGQINVFDDGGTIEDQSDDKFIILEKFPDPDNEGIFLTHTREYCIAQDKNGVIWLGTEQGPLLFHNPSKAFDPGFTCSRVKIPRNDGTNLADYLLISEKIKAIVIDGANRKWLGTESSGVYLMSDNGQETIHHFTVSNSPLLSNNILSIAINPVSGEVFFGTDKGIVSYQSDASDTGNTFGDVHAYPNPVRQGYNGVITITGLVLNTQVKITDLNGNLVCETISNGSIATWDGKDVHGRKVSTGIYLAICANADGTQSTITKIMVIN